MQTPPLSLYVHFPWCVRKCPYCDFNSHPAKGELPEAAYLDQLLCDLDRDLNQVPHRTIETIFIGGGTPSLISGRTIAALLGGIRRSLSKRVAYASSMARHNFGSDRRPFDDRELRYWGGLPIDAFLPESAGNRYQH